MGRAKILWSSTRAIDVVMTGNTIHYKIPLYIEKQFLGEVKDVSIKDGFLLVNYSATPEAKGYKDCPIVFEMIETELSFK